MHLLFHSSAGKSRKASCKPVSNLEVVDLGPEHWGPLWGARRPWATHSSPVCHSLHRCTVRVAGMAPASWGGEQHIQPNRFFACFLALMEIMLSVVLLLLLLLIILSSIRCNVCSRYRCPSHKTVTKCTLYICLQQIPVLQPPIPAFWWKTH